MLAVLAFAAVGGWLRLASHDGPELPLHYFLADVGGDRKAFQCDFSRDLQRDERFRVWEEPLQPCAIGYGWTQPSSAGIKAFGEQSSIEIFADATDYNLLILTLRARPHNNRERRQTMRVFLNGRRLDAREIKNTWTTLGIEIPGGRIHLGSNTVSFSFAYHISTNTAGQKAKKDHRRIAADLRALGLARTDGTAHSAHEMKRLLESAATPATPSVGTLDPASGRYRVEVPGTLVLPMEISKSSRRLTIEMTAASSLDIAQTKVLAKIINLSSGDTWSPPLPEWRENDGGSSLMAAGTIPIGRCAGAPCMVTLRVQPQPAGAAIEIAQPRQLAGSDTQTRKRLDPAATHQPTDNRPDIVLITLDAARTDHFSLYGYDRLTTPNIDRLAHDALVFHNAFALAPYTLCSVPTMVTGLSFLDHGVTQRGQTLSTEKFTLAEQLREAGYRTVCFSTNPHNSRTAGTAQGYDEFYELWTEVEGRASADPRFITERALETLAQIDDSQPLHLQLHYMPPHAPYNPAPEFDIFSDPDYDGPCDGTHRTINALDVGRHMPGEGCLDELIALYDGNLFAADYWVGRLLDALRARPRWKNTVVLVTADHGDAFLEHGRTGHNKTVFDEMLRVPFILRLPEDFEGRTFSSDRLVTLEDIVPTLLATASLKPAAPVTGVDLSRSASGNEPPPRLFISRTAHAVPVYALRTLRWKIILPASGHGELFNLASDPGELANLSFRKRPLFIALGQLLTWNLGGRPAVDSRAPTTDLPEEDWKMLEALGYVE
jgi:arylsulfatase